ncbi:fumarylacetoacetate hydrolase family protein [Paenibacillus endoradicis]|uniref:fumarylacetoacetate hydrolase family protein n=1 Tax=Paenibacillus endoradicis TaxID=2972487 RepID=UPI002158E94A|nr:fumarylacetoacetate hydrolase family protein [Paenibacillus endoradicis]MCR8657821.1 fumarylacetoacetate hydrolase family protein [Paenibacillus endoradicis]
MKLVTIRYELLEQVALETPRGLIMLSAINAECGTSWPINMLQLLSTTCIMRMQNWLVGGGWQQIEMLPTIKEEDYSHAPLYRNPPKIWGIGFNYVQSEAELKQLDHSIEPVGFMKPTTSLIGPGEAIVLPAGVGQINSEAELAIVIGRKCRHVSIENAIEYIAGFTATLDITAVDVHARNPRFLTRAKSYDTFFSLSSQLITLDEFPNLMEIEVESSVNGNVHHKNRVGHMRFDPAYAVAFHSQFMTLLPGDIILTGTPGAIPIVDGDTAECTISGFDTLFNPVVNE